MATVTLLADPVLDAEHKHLEEVLKNFEAAVLEGAPVEGIHALLSALLVETRCHFEAEEKLMERDGYEGRTSHARQHQHLLRCLGFMRNEYIEWNIRPESAMVAFLWSWLNEHISISDREYAENARTVTAVNNTTTIV